MLPYITVSSINCNRLFYLRSWYFSFIKCSEDYPKKEIIVIDNASVEDGTKEFLDYLEKENVKVIRFGKRDPNNEFAKGLNTIIEIAKGDYIIPMQGDMQFVVKNYWLKRYVELFEAESDSIGCVMLDAQRKITNLGHRFSEPRFIFDFGFVKDFSRPPICGAGDVMFRSEMIKMLYPWNVDNVSHEGGGDSETEMLKKANSLLLGRNRSTYAPLHPVAIGIFTDPRGTNARVRGDRRYGKYWAPKVDDHRYYDFIEYDEAVSRIKNVNIPLGIEEIAKPLGWEKMLDPMGNWLKNPIKPETARREDYVELDDLLIKENVDEEKGAFNDEAHVSNWLSG